jgi:hypothetical protein
VRVICIQLFLLAHYIFSTQENKGTTMKALGQILFFLVCGVSLLLTSNTVVAEEQPSFKDFIKDKTEHKGYFSFFHDQENGKIYLEINQFDQSFLFQSALPHGIGSNDIGLDRGQLGDTRLVQFERVGNKVLLRQLNPYYRADTENALEKQAISEAFASSIIWGFTVKNISKDQKRVLIDYTPFLLSDIHHLARQLTDRKQGSFKVDASRSALYQKRTKAFPHNTELEATVTFIGSGAGEYLRSVTPESTAITVNLHHSLIKLPDDNYQTRAFHPYSGYWPVEYADYAAAIDQPMIKRLIPRHRLTKKNPLAQMSEAVEPIIYYLDAGVPEPVRSALLDGASWWNKAFEAIGYKNAYQVKMLPSDADPMDVRYNVIQWVHRATRGWSYGSTVTDPRTGEILKGHVTLGSLRVRQDYLIALGLTSPFSEKNADTSAMKAMALARIRQLSAHEVGHTLGLIHNFSASINDRASVMDYPHPLIELKAGKIDLSNAYTKEIGEWDLYTIAYGYSDFTKGSVDQDDSAALKQLVQQTQAKGLLFMADEDARSKSSANNNAHLWDNGANASDELTRLLTVRAHALKNFGINTIDYGTPLSEIEQALVPIYNLHRFQVEAAAKMIAGVQYTYAIKGETTGKASPQGFNIVSAKEQQKALSALLATLSVDILMVPQHIINLIPPKAYGYYRTRENSPSNTGLTFDPISAAEASAKHAISFILNAERLARVQQQAAINSEINDVASIINQLLKASLYQRSQKGLSLLIQQRVNQQVIENLLGLWHQKGLVPEVRGEVYLALAQLAEWLDDNNDSRHYKGLHAQFILLEQQIEFSLTQGKQVSSPAKIALPPGSPIGG